MQHIQHMLHYWFFIVWSPVAAGQSQKKSADYLRHKVSLCVLWTIRTSEATSRNFTSYLCAQGWRRDNNACQQEGDEDTQQAAFGLQHKYIIEISNVTGHETLLGQLQLGTGHQKLGSSSHNGHLVTLTFSSFSSLRSGCQNEEHRCCAHRLTESRLLVVFIMFGESHVVAEVLALDKVFLLSNRILIVSNQQLL